MAREIRVELLPHERALLLNGRFTIDNVLAQLQACASSEELATITMTAADVHFLACDLTHAIVKRGRREEEIIELSERFDYIDDTSNGSLEGWGY